MKQTVNVRSLLVPGEDKLHIANQRQGVDQNHRNKPGGSTQRLTEMTWLYGGESNMKKYQIL